jgi:uncharacterized repeat protein (TIGR01451 family)
MNNFLKTAATLCAAAAFTLSAQAAFANTAANTQIFNQATLSYSDGATSRTATASVIVTVSLVPAAPTIAAGPPQSTSYAGPATVLHNTFVVTNNGNGPDTFTLSTLITGSTNTTGPGAAVVNPLAPATLALGGTITISGCTTTAIKVPSDGSAADSTVNGITGGSTVVIAGEVRTVSLVVDPGGTGTATITLASPLTSAPGAGVTVGEQKAVTVDVTAGTITTAGTDITVAKNLTATSTHAPNPTLTSASITDTYTSGVASLTKYVRNLTTSQAGTGIKLTHNTADYYPSGITAKTGDVLEYILLATNSGSGPVTASVITDILPTEFVTLKTGVYPGATDLAYESDTGVFSYLTQANDGDTGYYNAGTSTIRVNVGTGATANNGTNLGGSIGAGKSVYLYYQVTVK